MRVSFAGDSVGFSLNEATQVTDGCDKAALQVNFSLQPDWIDLTPEYDPSARASELDILQSADIDPHRFSVVLDWRRGGETEAKQVLNASRRFNRLSRVDVDACRTVLQVVDTSLYVSTFLSEAEYLGMSCLCEKFAQWSNPKAYIGRAELRLLDEGVLAAGNEELFLSFWRGERPLYSSETLIPSFAQNWKVPQPPTDHEKSAYHVSQI